MPKIQPAIPPTDSEETARILALSTTPVEPLDIGEAYDRARRKDDATEGAELHAINLERAFENGRAEYFNATLREGLEMEAKAKEMAARAEDLKRAGLNLQTEWDGLVQDLKLRGERVDGAKHHVQKEEDGITRCRAMLMESAGGENAMQNATAIVTREQRLPHLKEALSHAQGALRDHIAQMRTFAEKHKLPPEIIAAFPAAE